MTDTDKIGEWAETLDNLIHAAMLPMPAQFHIEQLTAAIAAMRDEMRAAFVAATGDNPWSGR